jgi:hypothetical protein
LWKYENVLSSAKKFTHFVAFSPEIAYILICENGGLCSFYAESGGVLIGFEK